MDLGAKAIHELFENEYGRMNALLGLEMKFTNGLNQTTIPYPFINPPTEFIDDTPNILTVRRSGRRAMGPRSGRSPTTGSIRIPSTSTSLTCN